MRDAEYDRWKTDPEYRTPEDREFDAQCDAYRSLDEFYDRRVVTDFTGHHFKPGQTVRWLDKDGVRCEGEVIGATEAGFHVDAYVVLHKGEVVEVSEICLMHGWEEPGRKAEEPKQTHGDDEIPF